VHQQAAFREAQSRGRALLDVDRSRHCASAKRQRLMRKRESTLAGLLAKPRLRTKTTREGRQNKNIKVQHVPVWFLRSVAVAKRAQSPCATHRTHHHVYFDIPDSGPSQRRPTADGQLGHSCSHVQPS
jgi:hypothetical protein